MSLNDAVHIRVKGPHFDAIGISDPGRARSENEDSIYLDEAGNFVLLADGMGGHERGAEASRTAINVVQEYLQPEVLTEQLMDITDVEGVSSEIVCLSSLVGDAIEKANAVIYGRNLEGQLKRFMGTTIVGLVPVKDGLILWFHVGDSRIYRLRDAALKCLTSDHSAYAEWVRDGREGEKPAKNIITRAVGPHTAASPDIGWDKQRKDDIYVLCSDGLTDMVSEDQISEILNPEENVDEMAQRLVDAANEAGGKDNVSVVVVKI